MKSNQMEKCDDTNRIENNMIKESKEACNHGNKLEEAPSRIEDESCREIDTLSNEDNKSNEEEENGSKSLNIEVLQDRDSQSDLDIVDADGNKTMHEEQETFTKSFVVDLLDDILENVMQRQLHNEVTEKPVVTVDQESCSYYKDCVCIKPETNAESNVDNEEEQNVFEKGKCEDENVQQTQFLVVF